jgi:hypothetical protein
MFVELPYGSDILVVATKNCNMVILVEINNYYNEQNVVARSCCDNVNFHGNSLFQQN